MPNLSSLVQFWPHIVAGVSFIAMFIWGYFKGKSSQKLKQTKEQLKDLKDRTERATKVRDNAKEVKRYAEELIKSVDSGDADERLSRMFSTFPVKDNITE